MTLRSRIYRKIYYKDFFYLCSGVKEIRRVGFGEGEEVGGLFIKGFIGIVSVLFFLFAFCSWKNI